MIVKEDKLYRVGFHKNMLYMIRWLSGIVEIRDTYWLEEEQVLVFIVKNIDKTNILFESGEIIALPIKEYQIPDQLDIKSFMAVSLS